MEKSLEEKRTNRLGTMWCVLGAVTWGLSGTFSQALFSNYTVNPTWVTSMRMVFAGLILLGIAFVKKSVNIKNVLRDKEGVVEILLLGIAGIMFCQVAYLTTIKYTDSGTATVIQNLAIVMIAVFVCVTTKTRPSKIVVFCIALALVGVWLLATGGKLDGLTITPKGLIWGLLTALGGAAYSLLSKGPVSRWGCIPATGMAMLCGGAVMSFIGKIWQVPIDMDARAWFYVAFIVIAGTAASFTFFLKGISMVGPIKASILGCLEPVTAVILSVVWLGTSFSVTDIIGFGCIMLIVFLIK